MMAFTISPIYSLDRAVHPPYPDSITPKEAQLWLQDTQAPVCVDVREAHEVAFCSLPRSIHIPLGSLPEKHLELPKGAPLLLLCHHGGRSARACEFLRSHGYQAINLTGGIDLWALDCDPALPRY
ncbi:MAG: hypothetical protein B7X06_00195 [Verrucomicrobia bacterium 21-51-4]|nr:MAG: hypothetical protein B7X06_00195 [Verrucomicrobia bacterium 21-51-4]HQU08427.1 rhodanese-like domain-containing protein [Opitutales bacterium]